VNVLLIDLGYSEAYRNRTVDLFITWELHTHKALDWPAIAASAKTTQPDQNDQTEVMYAQNPPTPTQVRLRRHRAHMRIAPRSGAVVYGAVALLSGSLTVRIVRDDA
jgi:hypothetical protein